jgi:uncharacterized protein (DUF1330 family)
MIATTTTAIRKLREDTVKTNYKVTIALAAGVAIGGAAVEGLHAQAKPPAYVVSEIDVIDKDAYAKVFVPLAVSALKESGRKQLAAGGRTLAISGEPPKSRVVLSVFENLEKAQEAYTSPAYLEARKVGDKYAKLRIFVVEGKPQN